MFVMKLHDKCKTATATGMNTDLVNIQKGEKRIKTNQRKRVEVHAEIKLLCGSTEQQWTKQYSGKENVLSVVQLKINFFQYT